MAHALFQLVNDHASMLKVKTEYKHVKHNLLAIWCQFSCTVEHLQVDINDHPRTVFPKTVMILWCFQNSQYLSTPVSACFYMPKLRAKIGREEFWTCVARLGRHFCGGGSSEKRVGSSRSMAVLRMFPHWSTMFCLFQPSLCRPHIPTRIVEIVGGRQGVPTCVLCFSALFEKLLLVLSFPQQSCRWVTLQVSLAEHRWFLNRIPLLRSSTGWYSFPHLLAIVLGQS